MIRDKVSNAVLENDTAELQRYRKDKILNNEIRLMKKDIEQIKNNIHDLLEKINRIEK